MRWAHVVSLLVACGCGPRTPAQLATWTEPHDVASIGTGDCVVLRSGRVRCEAGQLDALASGLRHVQSLASSKGVVGYPRCAVTAIGQVACFGCAARSGEYLPVVFQPISGVRQIALGTARACALVASGAIHCWGSEPEAQLTHDAPICRPTDEAHVVEQRDLPAAVHIAVTMDGQLCALTNTGAVLCDGTAQPLPLPATQNLVAGNRHFCALGRDGSVTCWGDNGYGQAGAATDHCSEPHERDCKVGPTRVQLSARALALAAGAEHTCAVLDDRGVACWGRNDDDALGFSSSSACRPKLRGACSPVPQRVSGIDDARELAASKSSLQTWVLSSDGDVRVWPTRHQSR